MKTKMPIAILCGGKGTRLKEETEFRPKPMVSVGDRPMIWLVKFFRFKRKANN